MLFEPHQITLKDGATITLRPPREGEGQALLDYLSEVLADAEYLLFNLGEVTFTLEQEEAIIGKWRNGPGVHVVAEAEGRVLAVCGWDLPDRQKVRHNANLGISIVRDWRGRGLGEALMRFLIEQARAHPEVHRLELAVFASNTPARALYKKVGFVEEGRLARKFRMPDGRFEDDVLMALWVK